jgi:hypothetical protein
MMEQDAKQAIIDYISQPPGTLQPSSPPHGVDQSRGWSGEVRSGGGLGAKPTTIRFFQERKLPHLQVHEVTFENETGKVEHWLCFMRQDGQGHWRLAGGGNVAEVGHSPKRSHPYANLAGGGGEGGFWAGGRVISNGLDMVRVRLISKNGNVLEDTVQDGLVLFVSDQNVQMPIKVELYDRSGKLVATHQALPSKSLHSRE